jgi:quercetin dioxygenase-like cupin family protein
MKIVALTKVPQMKIEADGVRNVHKQLPVSSRDGVPNFSFRVFTIDAGGHTPYHAHSSEHLNYAIEGEAVMVDETGAEHPFKAGDFAFVAPNEKHQFKNKSSMPFKFICAVPKKYE